MAAHFGGFKKESERDGYGFAKPENMDEEQYDKFVQEYMPVLERRNNRWQSLQGVEEGSLPDGFFEQKKLKRFVRKGIPPQMRPQMWMLLSGAQERMTQFPGEYNRLCQAEIKPDVLNSIDLDLERTYPENEYFRTAPGSLQKDLRIVLSAFANKNPHIGYCQGLNFLAGMLLLVLKDNEKAFWMMHTVTTNLPDYYSRGMIGLRVDMAVLSELIKIQAPQVAQLFDSLGFDPAMMVTKWFVCWFLETLPMETALRVWDCFFHEGSKILFRCALTLIVLNKAAFLKCRNFSDIMDLFKLITADSKVIECHQFMKDLFDLSGSMPSKQVETLREKHKTLLMADSK